MKEAYAGGAYEAGRLARKGITAEPRNPYTHGTSESDAWIAGYADEMRSEEHATAEPWTAPDGIVDPGSELRYPIEIIDAAIANALNEERERIRAEFLAETEAERGKPVDTEDFPDSGWCLHEGCVGRYRTKPDGFIVVDDFAAGRTVMNKAAFIERCRIVDGTVREWAKPKTGMSEHAFFADYLPKYHANWLTAFRNEHGRDYDHAEDYGLLIADMIAEYLDRVPASLRVSPCAKKQEDGAPEQDAPKTGWKVRCIGFYDFIDYDAGQFWSHNEQRWKELDRGWSEYFSSCQPCDPPTPEPGLWKYVPTGEVFRTPVVFGPEGNKNGKYANTGHVCTGAASDCSYMSLFMVSIADLTDPRLWVRVGDVPEGDTP